MVLLTTSGHAIFPTSFNRRDLSRCPVMDGWMEGQSDSCIDPSTPCGGGIITNDNEFLLSSVTASDKSKVIQTQ